LLLSALTLGFILSLLALGVYISFKIFAFSDITAEGSITTGAAVAAVLLVHHWPPLAAMAAAMFGGALVGVLTGMLAMKFQINRLLSGILTMTALYSINLRIMGKSNLPLMNEHTMATQAEQWGLQWFGAPAISLWGWDVPVRDAMLIVMVALLIFAVA